MPCHDGPPKPFTLLEARERIDELTRYMCEAVYLLERGRPISDLSMPAQAWVRRHKEIDAQRERMEKDFKDTHAKAMAKLTREEQMVLGVGDWNMKDYQ